MPWPVPQHLLCALDTAGQAGPMLLLFSFMPGCMYGADAGSVFTAFVHVHGHQVAAAARWLRHFVVNMQTLKGMLPPLWLQAR